MRDHPLLLVLDEPTAALVAETEHGLFVRYGLDARCNGHTDDGRIITLVSHGFFLMHMAHIIDLLDDLHLADAGTHDTLIVTDSQYAVTVSRSQHMAEGHSAVCLPPVYHGTKLMISLPYR